MAPKTLRLSLASALLVLGCGGRSDMNLDSDEFPDPSETGGAGASGTFAHGGGFSGFGGWISEGGATVFGGTSYGAATARGGGYYGGTYPGGGTSARGGGYYGGTYPGGATNYGGTGNVGGYAAEPCCVAHPTAGCNDSAITQCVCRRDAICCTTGWDAICVQHVAEFGCGNCSAGGAGGAGGAYAASGSGNVSSMGGSAILIGGAPATGGALPAGGVPASGGTLATGGAGAGPNSMIDDLEDGNGDIINAEGRQGYWYTFNDNTQSGTQTPVWDGRIPTAFALDDRPGSKFCAVTQGSGFTDWGAGVGLYLKGSGGFYNATKYRGITFWAKVDPGRANVIRVNVSDDQTVDIGNNSYCTSCWDHFGVTVVLDTKWQRFSFLWANLTQEGWGAPLAPSINNSKLHSIEFGTQPGIDFGIYIDDIAFIP